MRSEQEMLDLIVSTARNDERIRAVIMNGSRVNPNAPRDIFQDYDIVYLVSEVASFTADHSWVDRFGERIILQMPEAMSDPPAEDRGWFTYLMQFADGNRIDLTLFPVAMLAEMEDDSLTLVLLDKDGLLPAYPPPTDSGYLPKPPSAKAFADCCNEFWWVSPYVAKGLWRQELTYSRQAMDEYVRSQLMKMLTWYIGTRTDFKKCTGKDGKYFKRYLEPELWGMLERTYADAGYEHTWQALFTMGDLFRRTALAVAAHFGFEYPHGDDTRASAHLQHVHHLPRDAAEMY